MFATSPELFFLLYSMTSITTSLKSKSAVDPKSSIKYLFDFPVGS